MVALLNDGYLPWNNLSRNIDRGESGDSLLKLRSSNDFQMDLINLSPPAMRELFIKIFRLQFSEEPPYDEINESLLKEFGNAKDSSSVLGDKSHQFEWILQKQLSELHNKKEQK